MTFTELAQGDAGSILRKSRDGLRLEHMERRAKSLHGLTVRPDWLKFKSEARRENGMQKRMGGTNPRSIVGTVFPRCLGAACLLHLQPRRACAPYVDQKPLRTRALGARSANYSNRRTISAHRGRAARSALRTMLTHRDKNSQLRNQFGGRGVVEPPF